MEIRQFRVVLRARRFDRTCHFYNEILGLPRHRSWEGNGARGALFQAGPGLVEVHGRSRDKESEDRDEAFDYQGPDHKITVTLVVPSAEQAYERLLLNDRNIPGGLMTMSDGTLAFETHDPDGIKLRLREAEA
jgi:catechol 2,3-dioxygenase-like lactoylglutathione lyase family enzyme